MNPLVAPNPDFRTVTAGFITAMPIMRHFGFSIGKIEPGYLEIIQPYRTELSFAEGFFQAGAVGTIADFAGAGACVTMLPVNWQGATVDYSIKLFAPATGEKLIARGRVIQPGRTLSVAAADVYAVKNGIETHCATALVSSRNFEIKG